MSHGPIDEDYFNWLCAKVLTVHIPNYRTLMEILYRTEFTWKISRDSNRAEDGIELREDFLRETRYEYDAAWFRMPCSVLEMFIALSKRAAFQTDGSAKDWFWTFLRNLNLDEYRQVERSDEPYIRGVLRNFLWRTYEANGFGGMFPLRNPRRDQRSIEIWWQFCDYLNDSGLLISL